MLYEDPDQPIRCEPAGDDGPCYLLRVPRVIDRHLFSRAVRLAGGRHYPLLDMVDALSAALGRVLPADEDVARRDRLQAVIAEYRGRLVDFVERNSAGEIDWDGDLEGSISAWREASRPSPEVDAIDDLVSRLDQRYLEMREDNRAYNGIAALVAARMFLIGWERVEMPFRRTAEGVPDSILRCIPPEHLSQILLEITQRLEPPAATTKNFGSRPGGPHARTTSSTGPTPAPMTY